MKLTPPKTVTFWISVVLVVLGALSTTVAIPIVSSYSLLFVIIGFVVLALGTLVKGL